MKYLSLDQNELRELRNLRLGSLSFSMAIIFLAGIATALIANHIFSLLIVPLAVSVLVIVTGILFVFYANRAYIADLQQKKKKIYKGVLSSRRISTRHGNERFEFNVDGNIFIVDKESFTSFQEGDLLEFHIAPSLKHLFKIEKVG